MTINIPSFGFDAGGSRYNPNETAITQANMGTLVQKWAYTAGDKVRSSMVVDGTNGLGFTGARDSKAHGIVLATGAAASGWPITVDGMVDSTPYCDVANNRIFVATKGDGATYGRVYCFNRAGATVWGPYTTHGPVSAHINADGTRIYFSDDLGWIYALNGATGAESWAPVNVISGSPPCHAGVGMPALVGTSVVYAVADGLWVRTAATGAAVRVMNCRYGAAFSSLGDETIPYVSGSGAALHTPGLVTFTLAGASDHYQYMFDFATGKVIWSRHTPGQVLCSGCFSPPDNLVTTGRHDWAVVTLSRDTGKLDGNKPYFSATSAAGIQSSPCVAGPGTAGNQMAFCGQMKDDSRMFGFKVGVANNPPFKSWAVGAKNDTYSSPCVANGLVLWGNDDHNVYCYGLP